MVRGLQRNMDHGGVSNDAEVPAFSDDASLAQGYNVIFRGDFVLDAAVQILVLEKYDGIVIADGGLDQALCIVCAWRGRPL